ncbi:hypothetical protein PF008_g16658 [Phytophthora fragariae]|uniref:Uncharacterized protein n=1 Tax=Phytophthora fragariae TaxID=53985 RepID=A0A6G0RAJ1_9STRA|nr:hypothetical protein PF008_g16658 [Phytophthora fragariae]
MEAGTWATARAGSVPVPSPGTGRVRTPNAGVYCTVEAVCNVEVTSGVAVLPPAAAANCRSAAGIGVSGAEVSDTASGVLVAAGSVRDIPAPLDVVLALLDPEVVVDELVETAAGALDVVDTLAELPMSVDVTPDALTPICVVSAEVVAWTGATRATGVSCSVGPCPPLPEEEAVSCDAVTTLSDMNLGTARLNCECVCRLSCEVAEC